MTGNGQRASPQVSVVTTTFRTPAPLLSLAVDSVLRQTFDDLELVVVADGPLDADSERVLDERDDPRVVVVRPGRVGRARALNLGIEHARGALVAIQDADDASHVERLARQVGALDRRPDVDLVGAGVHRRGGMATADWALPPQTFDVEVLDRKLLVGNPLVHSSVMARRDALEAVGGYAVDRRYQFDHDLYLRLREAGMGLGRLRDPLIVKRVHGDQVFETSSLVPRLVSAWHLQVAHARHEPQPARSVLIGAASVRFAARALRGSIRGVRRRGRGPT